MNRVIKFRGKRVDNGEWVCGSLLQFHPHHFARKNTTIVEAGCIYYEVDPSTVGQFTGLHDKDGNEIWEGDTWLPDYNKTIIGKVTVEFREGKFNISQYVSNSGRVIGNIHDNPKLLKS